MTKEEYLRLYERSLKGQCTEQELAALASYTDDFSLISGETVAPEQSERIYSNLQKAIAESNSRNFRFISWKTTAAAAILVFILGSLLYFFNQQPQIQEAPVLAKVKRLPIQPGSDQAILTLSDGTDIVLNKASSGQIASENGTEVIKDRDGSIVYETGTDGAQTATFNTITIPRGGQYNLTLPDGSKVWLNSASKLRFPTRFSGNSREVELEGEGYFEVAKNAGKPFFVNTGNMKVKVLGTHFNVMAYRDESYVRTTLLEGKVMLMAGNSTAMIKPNQQGVFNGQGFKVSAADVDEDMAWKNGYFIFNEENLASIMRKVSRWYDVDVSFETTNKNLTYTGTVSRFKNISEVLKVLSLTGTVKFKIEERRVKVTN